MAPRSKDAVYSGYAMFVDDFKKFFVTLQPDLANEALPEYIMAYDCWRRRLNKAERSRVPKLRLVPFEGTTPSGMPTEDKVEKAFFPTRYVRYTNAAQLRRDEEHQNLWKDNEVDRALFAEFVRFVESLGGKLDSTKVLDFGCFRDRHPDFLGDF
ncbi:unnamed protein product [Somion occarium]|uniref:Uncharacterized protein n=1 Tax=Somion occarium TaxID=3059160 RepID=A0ABP1CPT2_9APHY